MPAPNMSAITASLQNCSLNQHQPAGDSSSGDGSRRSSLDSGNNSDTIVELNSDISLPYHWEQCLDLKTGEIYYINWRTGMKVTEDPRTMGDYSGYYYSEEDDDESSYDDSEESSSESCPPSVMKEHHYREEEGRGKEKVLVVAGCKSCLMYFMVPKQVEDCPRCSGQLLHFDGSENSSLN